MTVDASEFIIAFLDPETRSVRQAVWSASKFLSIIHHNAMYMEHSLYRVMREVEAYPEAHARLAEVRREFWKFDPVEAPGYKSLLSLFKKRLPPSGGALE